MHPVTESADIQAEKTARRDDLEAVSFKVDHYRSLAEARRAGFQQGFWSALDFDVLGDCSFRFHPCAPFDDDAAALHDDWARTRTDLVISYRETAREVLAELKARLRERSQQTLFDPNSLD